MIFETAFFILFVGIGATIALDIWAKIAARLGWLSATHWPSVGRWLAGLPRGHLIANVSNTSAYTRRERILGWGFHYLVGISYAAMYPLFWGIHVIHEPVIFPFVLIGIVLSTLAGLFILVPGMGGGLLARKTPCPLSTIAYVIVAHLIFASTQYLLALTIA